MNTPETEFPNPAEYQPEWLSAYLDDELPEPQRLVVQQRLESDPAARQVLEDLQRIRHLVGQLPAWSGRDLPPVLPTDAAVESTETPPVDPTADARAADDSEAVDSAGGVDPATVDSAAVDPAGGPAENFAAELLAGRPPAAADATYGLQRSRWERSRAWLKPLGMAICLLAMLGIGFALWSSDRSRTLAIQAPAKDNALENASTAEDTAAATGAMQPGSELEIAAAPWAAAAQNESLRDDSGSQAAGAGLSYPTAPLAGQDFAPPATGRSREMPRGAPLLEIRPPDASSSSFAGNAAPGALPRTPEADQLALPYSAPDVAAESSPNAASDAPLARLALPPDTQGQPATESFALPLGKTAPRSADSPEMAEMRSEKSSERVPETAARRDSRELDARQLGGGGGLGGARSRSRPSLDALRVGRTAAWSIPEVRSSVAALAPAIGLQSTTASDRGRQSSAAEPLAADPSTAAVPAIEVGAPLGFASIRRQPSRDFMADLLRSAPQLSQLEAGDIDTPGVMPVEAKDLGQAPQDADAAGPSRIALFVLRSEAQQILQSVAEQGWQASSPVWITSAGSTQLDAHDKVILLLTLRP